ncbi:MAG: serine/threonine protein kinase [Verrucomicrobiales bacterium]|nr:serine/threonine protein kinase [Verrucomicrobiales bacterium]
MQTCCECGAPLRQGYPAGICPRCLRQTQWDELPGGEIPICPDFDQRYRLTRLLERGGQGEIHLARDLRFERDVVLKRLAPELTGDLAQERRFLHEARIAGRLNHPGLLPIFDVARDPTMRPFFTSLPLPGASLAHVIHSLSRSGRTFLSSLNRVLAERFLRLCEIMGFAHAAGVIHTDLKPTNIMLGEFGKLFVIDFGSATDREAKDGEPIAPAITPPFAPPELLAGQPAVTPQTDIYAAGVMLYELCVGQLPHSDEDGSFPKCDTIPARQRLIQRILNSEPVPVRALDRRIPKDLAAICGRAMAREPSERYASFEALADDLRNYLEIRPIKGADRLDRAWKAMRRHSAAVIVGALITLALAGAGFFSNAMWQRQRNERQMRHLQDADGARRNGLWRDVLSHLDAAQRDDYSNAIDLSLRRVAAWAALGQHQHVRSELQRLVRGPDLGRYRGHVLLRMAEDELFDTATADAGLRHARESLDAGLETADKEFALGLLAESSTNSLHHFHEALKFDPFHHGAHAMSLSLELILGEHEKLAAHIEVFKAFFPEDPTLTPIQVMLLALDGRVREAEEALSRIRGSVNPNSFQWLMAHMRLLADAPKLVDVEVLLSNSSSKEAAAKPNELLMNVISMFQAGSFSGGTATNLPGLRIPQLPPMKGGLIGGMQSLVALAFFGVGDAGTVVDQVKAASDKHPEALLPLFAGILLDAHRPGDGQKLREFLQMQRDLFQMAWTSPSVLRGTDRVARFLLMFAQFELVHRVQPADDSARRECVRLLQTMADDSQTGPKECEAGFNQSFRLGEFDLSREFLTKWHRLELTNNAISRRWIQLDASANTAGKALDLIHEELQKKPGDAWLLEKREHILRQIRRESEQAELGEIQKRESD